MSAWNLCCGQDDEVDIAAPVWIRRLCPDGTDVTRAHKGDHEWDDHSPVYCNACHSQGEVRHLRGNERDGPCMTAAFFLPSGQKLRHNREG